ncbi:UvrD-helicase domain-containing protein [Psychrobacter immobilis]|uniref:UvrD-helicase domain-containing protein n=2 Tax=Psychrobacter immobilis TaxID=498 RepID=UPI00191B30E7|nr:UvrD-helicase domain-containing protein [Psychrobacter immobilis]
MNFELTGVDNQIYEYIESKNSFLLFAGAGSGKTRTLVNLLQQIKRIKKNEMLIRGQKVAVITYTNSACDEIQHRLKHDSLFTISTIHSFAWELIKPFTEDIRSWKKIKLEAQVLELENKATKARNDDARAKHEANKQKRQTELDELNSVNDFIYSATQQLFGKGTLNHTDVIQICAHFLNQHELMRKIIANQFPIVFIDECQDTQKDLLQAIIQTQEQLPEQITIGLFGDLMQRIYSDGYTDIVENLPANWKTPEKTENYRCPNRVRELINKVRMLTDKLQQIQPADTNLIDGTVRLFVTNSATDATQFEQSVENQMSEICGDEKWQDDIQTLVLEHKMSAKRGDFLDFYEPLSRYPATRDNLLQGTGTNISFLREQLQPLLDAISERDDFTIMRILEAYCPRMQNNELLTSGVIREVSESLSSFRSSLDINQYSISEILVSLKHNELLDIPEKILACIDFDDAEQNISESLTVWKEAFKAPYAQLTNYFKYIENGLGFSTHQSVKGLEYPRVLAILNDSESGGFLFKYEKMLEATPLSTTDKKNILEGKETVLDRTRRLFYVICSRAQESLAIVVYSENPQAVKDYVVSEEWFTEEEVILNQ